jgi:hypothetical protein
MSTTASSPTVALSADRPRAGLALVLALLSVPGSTVAWYVMDLGGLIIGLPLGIAAIVLGTRARRALAGAKGAGMALAAVIIAGLAIGQMVVYYAVEALA